MDSIKVLLIEDAPEVAKLISVILETCPLCHIDTVWSSSLNVGFNQLAKDKFDIILLDLHLPDSTGISTLNIAYEKYSHVPIVVITGDDDFELGNDCVKRGAEDFLRKAELKSDALYKAIIFAILRHRFTNELIKTIRECRVEQNKIDQSIVEIKSYLTGSLDAGQKLIP